MDRTVAVGGALRTIGGAGLVLAALALGDGEAGAASVCGAGGIATKTWDGGASTASWHDANNWTDDEVPQSDDHVCIPSTAPATVNYSGGTTSILSIESQVRLNVTGGSLSFTDSTQDSTTTALTLASNTGVTLGGAGDLSVGDFAWNGGTISASSPTTTTTVTESLDVSTGNISNRTLNIAPGVAANFTGAGVFSTLGLETNAVLDIDAGATFQLTSDGDVGSLDATTLVRNDGTIAKTGGSGTSRLLLPVENNAGVDVQAGRLQFNRSVSTDGDGGNFDLSEGTTLDFVGGTNALGPTTISDGAASATVRFGDGNNTTLTAANALTVENVLLAGSSPTVTLTGANTVPHLTLNLPSGGTLGGAGNLSVGDFDWSGGTISASSPTTTTTVTGDLDVSSGGISNRTLNIPAGVTASYTGNAGVFSTLGLSTNAVLDIDSGGTFELTGDADLGNSDATTLVRNDGTLAKTGGGGTSRFLAPVLNNGETETLSGTLQTANSLQNPGTLDVKSGTTIDVASSFSNFSGTTLTGGTYLVAGTLRIPGSTSVTTNAATIDLNGATAQIVNRDNSLNGLRNLDTNAAAGSLTIRNGKDLTTPGALANDGVLGIGQASTFTTTGNYTQAGGATLRPEIGPTGHGRLVVNGTTPGASLAGTLDIVTATGFTPTAGSTFEIEAGTRTGTFATVTGAGLPNGAHYDVQYAPASVTLVRSAAPDMAIDDVSAAEGNSGTKSFSFTVSLSGPAGAGGATVHYATSDGAGLLTSAVAPGDYTSTSGDLAFGPGETTKTVVVDVKGDDAYESNEGFSVRLTNPSGAVLTDDRGTGTIVNDDDPATLSIGDVTQYEGDSGSTIFEFEVQASKQPTGGNLVGVDVTEGSATFGGDIGYLYDSFFRFPQGATSATVEIEVFADTTDEPDEEFFVDIHSEGNETVADGRGVGTVLNDDQRINIADVRELEGNSGSKPFVFTVSLTGPAPVGGVTADYATTDGSAKAPEDYVAESGQISIPEGQTSATIDIAVKGDSRHEPVNVAPRLQGTEEFRVDLSNPSGAKMGDSQGVGFIANDDGPEVSIEDYSVLERDQDTYLWYLRGKLSGSPYAEGFKVDWATSDGTARAGTDYSAAHGTLSIPQGQYAGRIGPISVKADTLIESDETIVIKLSNPRGGSIADGTGTLTIRNDDFRSTQSLGGSVDIPVACVLACTVQGSGSLLLTRPSGKMRKIPARAAGGRYRLRSISKRIAAGKATKLKLKLPGPALKAARKTLSQGGDALAKVEVKTTEAGGPTRKQRFRIRLK